jgi:hypothetical protein
MGTTPAHVVHDITNQKYRIRKIMEEQQMGKQICFCFGYSESDIEKDVIEQGKSLIMEKIIAEKKAGGCQCETKNPKGR